MPLRVEVPSAFPQARFVFLSKEPAPNLFIFAPISTCKLSSTRIRVPEQRTGTLDGYGLHNRKQKTCICSSANPSSTKNSIKHTVKEEKTHPYGAHKEDSPAAGNHRPSAQHSFSSMVLSPPLSPPLNHSELPFPQHVFFLLGSVTIAVCGAFIALVATAIPTLNAMRRAAISMERLADTAREELPGTMAAVRLSGMEISDLTLELSDLSQEISESVKSSARAVRAAEVGIRRMGSAAASQTLSLLQEHASGPVEAVKPVVATAAETTRQAMTQAHKAVLGLAGMPVLSNWIQKKKFEEQKKIEEGISLESSSEFSKQSDPELIGDS